MTSFETRLKDGLSAEDEAFLKNLEDGESLFGQLGATFAGPMRVWTGFAFVLSAAMFALAVGCFTQMFGAGTVREMLLWMTGVICAVIAVSMIKVWFWLRMNHLALLRELKRIELRLARSAV